MAMERPRRLIDPLGSSASGCTSEPDHDPSNYSVDDSDEEDGGISFTTTETKCERLYEQGLELKLCGELKSSLTCFLDCLRGMQECQYFAKLPQTLHQLGEVYHSLGIYDKAVEFAQAEKLFYEAVVVGSDSASKVEAPRRARSKRRPFSRRTPSNRSSSGGSNPAEYGDLLIKKAEEYEMLARICAKEKKFDLAVDYSGKAAKLKRSVYGPDDPITLASLEYFTLVYAEMGRMEYALAVRQAEEGINTSQSTVESKKTKEESVDNDPPQPANGHENKTCTVLSNHERSEGHTSSPGSNRDAHASLLEPSSNNTQETESHNVYTDSHHESITSHTLPKVGNAEDRGHEPDWNVTNLQVCRVDEHSLNTKLANDIHWTTDNDCEYTDCVEVGVINTDSNVEHTRFCPLWVLLLGAFLEMALVAYVMYQR